MNRVVQVQMRLAVLIRKPKLQGTVGERCRLKLHKSINALCVLECGNPREQQWNQYATGRHLFSIFVGMRLRMCDEVCVVAQCRRIPAMTYHGHLQAEDHLRKPVSDIT